MFDEDLSVFFSAAEFAVTATWGGMSAQILFDMPTEDVLGGRAQSNEYLATLPADAFPGLTRGGVIVISSPALYAGSYQLRQTPNSLHDGALKTLSLTRL